MKDMKPIENKNAGFSLVELIVSMLIMSVIMGIVMMLISGARATYSAVKTQAVLQEEADTIRRVIGEIAVEADPNSTYSGSGIEGGNRYIYIYAPDNDAVTPEDREKKFYYIFLLKDGMLRFGKFPSKSPFPVGEDAYGIKLSDPYSVLAEHVKEIDARSLGSLFTVSLKLEYNGNEYSTTMNYSGRNK